MAPAEDVFRFISIRDPQRISRPIVLRAPSYDPDAPSRLHEAIVSAGSLQARTAAADAYSTNPSDFAATPADRPNPPRFVRTLSLAGAPISQLSRLLLARGDRLAGKSVAELGRTMLAAFADFQPGGASTNGSGEGEPGDDPSLRTLLGNFRVHGLWRDTADSMLAATFGGSPSSIARGDLGRALMLWSLLDRLATNEDYDPDRIAELLSTGIVLVPSVPTFTSGLSASGDRPGSPSAPTIDLLARLRTLADAATEVRRVAASVDAFIDADTSNGTTQVLSSTTVAVLAAEAIDPAAGPLLSVADALDSIQAQAVTAALPQLSTSDRRAALVAELIRQRGWNA